MDKARIFINSKEYEVYIAETEKEKAIGLQGVSELKDNEGMLFIYDEPQTVSFWMKDTIIPLDIIFIDDDGNVINVHNGIPESEELLTENDTVAVLELNDNSGIKRGNKITLEPTEEEPIEKIITVLDDEGKKQVNLKGGERIFSRIHTKSLIKYAKIAKETKEDKDYIKLGKKIFEFMSIQDDTPNEYVDSPA